VITFRYHIVSLVAVFLALALGIVVGTTALNGPVTSDLRHQVNSLKTDRSRQADQIKKLQSDVEGAGLFASTFGPKLVAGTLKGQSVLIVGLPGATVGMQDGIAAELTAAGASLTGRLEIGASYIQQALGSSIVALATGPNHPPGVSLPVTSDPGRLGGALLAYVLLGKGQPTDLTAVLAGFSRLNMITSDAADVEPATNVVVVGIGAEGKNAYAGANERDLVSALNSAGGKVVVAGDSGSALANGVVALVRNSPSSSSVSTIDNANSPFGQVSTALAMAGTIAGQVGQYGSGPGASALFPIPSK
jgi:hypothetical protein